MYVLDVRVVMNHESLRTRKHTVNLVLSIALGHGLTHTSDGGRRRNTSCSLFTENTGECMWMYPLTARPTEVTEEATKVNPALHVWNARREERTMN